jgi:putative DNA primase/helicase
VLTGTPCWAAINAQNMEGWFPPPGVKHVVVFGDCDSSMTGQSASFGLAKRLRTLLGLSVDVRLPQTEDTDWNDVLRLERGAA